MAKTETQFRKNRIDSLKSMYADDQSSRRRQDSRPNYQSTDYANAAAVRKTLWDSIGDPTSLVETSRKLYATNPVYASVINYLADMYTWNYKVIPHKLYAKSKAKLKKKMKDDDFQLMYNLMLEVVDGLSIETKFPSLLTLLFMTGSVYFTTYCDEENYAIDTILLPNKYCRKIGETQFGAAIIQLDMSYVDDLGGNSDELKKAFLEGFPVEFKKYYNAYKRDSKKRWATLDPRFSSAILLNDAAIPTFFYLYGGILDYEKYQDNELQRNENLLKYIVVQTMPHYEDKLIFEVDEVEALHKSLRRIVETNDKARLITTYGDIKVAKIAENDTSENEVLSKAFKAIFNNAGFNSAIFTAESVNALQMSLVRDKGFVWRYVQKLVNFYNIAINNWFDFKTYQADIEILPISPYTISDDIKRYKENATLGVGKLDYFIASGIKQKNIQDQLDLEDFLKLDGIKPMQTSYTQTAEDRKEDSKGNSSKQNTNQEDNDQTDNKDNGDNSSASGNEPSEQDE